jgi:hypothetical protein
MIDGVEKWDNAAKGCSVADKKLDYTCDVDGEAKKLNTGFDLIKLGNNSCFNEAALKSVNVYRD